MSAKSCRYRRATASCLDSATGAVGKRAQPFAFTARTWESEQPPDADFELLAPAELLERLHPLRPRTRSQSADQTAGADRRARGGGKMSRAPVQRTKRKKKRHQIY